MNIKQIRVSSFVPLLALMASMAVPLVSPEPAAALSEAEKKACFEQWAGAYVGSSGDGKKLTDQQLTNFQKNSKCNVTRGGSCKEEKLEDGASILCQRKDGKYVGNEGNWESTAQDDKTPDDTTPDSTVAGNDCAGVKTAIIKCDATNTGDEVSNNGIWALLMMVVNIMTAGIGILAVAGIVYGAILYTTAEDKADQIKKAQGIITNVIIGLVMYSFMWVGLNFIVPGGVFAG